MTIATLRVPLDDRTAYALQTTSPEKQALLHQMIGYLVQQFVDSTPESLFALMDEMSREAEINGLTPEILEAILDDE
ncbi:MAG: hypothetical protein KBG20_03095 [Caldilineaceae bacterium]|nr:hypothetical protein [Caldilineaceae bacterium]MBP8107723.1 hypothetical protein [Caldilineaceae bacterium]MBP8122858.1 hypothetical protein [Caldilineaceae bacterium]MBP9071252.1 hypothetical protein [Caldilineaceae bacterium]